MQQAGNVVNVAGQRSGHNIYLLDGVKVTDEYFNNLVVSPSIDAIEEFKIQKSQYPAEFGGKASALVNVATKGGTNAFHGDLFEFVRNYAFEVSPYTWQMTLGIILLLIIFFLPGGVWSLTSLALRRRGR
jgi:hypothetical protein